MRHRRIGGRRGFTLVELLTVMGILAVLLALLLPSMMRARQVAMTVQCANNMRQVCTALLGYASQNNGRFPPNGDMTSWYAPSILDPWLAGDQHSNGTDFRGPILACPNDEASLRTYAMNLWMSSSVDDRFLTGFSPPRGVLWRPAHGHAAQMILLVETWSYGWDSRHGYASAFVGVRGTTPGQRFGARGGYAPPFDAYRFGKVNCDLAYYLHRVGGGDRGLPVGVVNIGYADGHVATKSNEELANPLTGRSTLDSLWSPLDPVME